MRKGYDGWSLHRTPQSRCHHEIVGKLMSVRGDILCPAFISWRLDTKESDRPSHTGNNSMFFLQIPVKYNVVCACCCRIHSGKISFYNKNPKYLVAFVSMINCGKINFFVYVRVSFIVHLSGPRQQFSSYHEIHSSRLTNTKLSKRFLMEILY